ncbi:MAG: MotA/TolQ/ExbB proton channel family protein [Lentisphaerae bacterium]|nr:MotA/TolQ/ExbB proton channel family protein [Lentisphaerota bacterium]
MVLCAAACGLAVAAAWGQGAGAGEAAAAEGLSWRQILESGGWLMYVLAALSVLTVALVVYFAAVLRTGQIAPRRLRRVLMDQIRGGSIEDARKACDFQPCPLAAIAATALDYVRESGGGDPMLLKDMIESEGGRQAESLQGQTQYLYDIGVIAPMIGLLGTVFGMLRAFGSVALNEAAAKPVVLAQGVSQALITTAFGLIVGIPAMIFYAFFRRRAAGRVAHLEAVSAELLTALASRNAS